MLAVSPTVLIRIRTAYRFTVVRAVLSPASPATTISAATVARLRLRTPVRGPGGVCYLTLRNNLGGHEEFSVCANIETISPTPTPLRSLSQQTVQAFNNLRLADPSFHKAAPVEMILGADLYAKLLQPGLMPSIAGQLVAQNTLLGWVISGVTH
ncbi:PREDICTED: uncharacterized protein LOC108358661 [Rhagoletis zephyria]|uniref:uncharacterized protein LOC108358661 n=1 Tax=Rhagoletis zephyria TaxID=28612 RepID=UPI0008113272|nr:PREDICTED: uncharacterized protein LOC108358661 [Rhagoletis zephyria]